MSLLARQADARELLAFYVELLDLQEPLYRRSLASSWLPVVVAPPGDGFPMLRLWRLPPGELVPSLRRLLRGIAAVGTETIAATARVVRSAGAMVQQRLLEEFLAGADLQMLAASLGCDGHGLEFCARALWQPVAEAMAAQNSRDVTDYRGNSCPQCGSPPQVAVLRDEPTVKGQRLLVCSLCSSSWAFPRSTCPRCGEAEPDKLIYHENARASHIRVEECATCSVYLKAVDLRKDGAAVPIVEDLASAELDLWSAERGLRKLRRNVLGL